MIHKTIMVGQGKGPQIDMRRYRDAKIAVSGLKNGVVTAHTFTSKMHIKEDGEYSIPSTDMLVIDAETKSCVIVKLMAHNL